MGCREPCQAGNRAALSGFSMRRSKSAHSCIRVHLYFYTILLGGVVMYRALYRKYRPQVFSDVVGQDHITETLKNQLSSGKIFHAYLFTGTRGTGKTTCAKILAKAVNCLNLKDGNPCGECAACKSIDNGEVMDINEIDAASNNSVDDIRELRDRIAFAPADLNKRVYIIDEVHMLTTAAFNALLKTLEEPPSHVVFILATTEVHKLPATILSRCQRFDFKRINTPSMSSRLTTVCDEEGFTITPDALQLICSIADGGMRDALSILDLCSAKDKNITEEVVSSVCSMAGKEHLVALSKFIEQKSTKDVLDLVDKLYSDSVDMQRLTSDLISHYRNLLIIKTVNSDSLPIVCSAEHLQTLKELAKNMELNTIMWSLRILCDALAAMKNSNARLELELALVSLCTPQNSGDLKALEIRLAALERKIESGAIPQSTAPKAEVKLEPKKVTETESDDINQLPPLPKEEELPPPPEIEVNSVQEGEQMYGEWFSVLNILKTTCPLMYGALVGSKAYIKGDLLLIDAPNPTFRNLVKGDNATYRDSIRKAAEQVSGKVFKLGPYTKAPTKDEMKADPLKALAEKLNNL